VSLGPYDPHTMRLVVPPEAPYGGPDRDHPIEDVRKSFAEMGKAASSGINALATKLQAAGVLAHTSMATSTRTMAQQQALYSSYAPLASYTTTIMPDGSRITRHSDGRITTESAEGDSHSFGLAHDTPPTIKGPVPTYQTNDEPWHFEPPARAKVDPGRLTFKNPISDDAVKKMLERMKDDF
jgi:hypothetical protein